MAGGMAVNRHLSSFTLAFHGFYASRRECRLGKHKMAKDIIPPRLRGGVSRGLLAPQCRDVWTICPWNCGTLCQTAHCAEAGVGQALMPCPVIPEKMKVQHSLSEHCAGRISSRRHISRNEQREGRAPGKEVPCRMSQSGSK